MTYPFEAAVFAGRNRNRVYEIVIKKVEEAAEKDGLTKTAIAARLGRSLPQISMWLKGPSNWTLDTVSDLLWAVDAEMDYHAISNSQRNKSNLYNPHKIERPPSPPQFKIVESTAEFSLDVAA